VSRLIAPVSQKDGQITVADGK